MAFRCCCVDAAWDTGCFCASLKQHETLKDGKHPWHLEMSRSPCDETYNHFTKSRLKAIIFCHPGLRVIHSYLCKAIFWLQFIQRRWKAAPISNKITKLWILPSWLFTWRCLCFFYVSGNGIFLIYSCLAKILIFLCIYVSIPFMNPILFWLCFFSMYKLSNVIGHCHTQNVKNKCSLLPAFENQDFQHIKIRFDHSAWHSCFSDFIFKIRLIRLGFSFQKAKQVLYLNSQPTDSLSGVLTTTPQSQLWEGDTEKLSVAFSHAWLILVQFT